MWRNTHVQSSKPDSQLNSEVTGKGWMDIRVGVAVVVAVAVAMVIYI